MKIEIIYTPYGNPVCNIQQKIIFVTDSFFHMLGYYSLICLSDYQDIILYLDTVKSIFNINCTDATAFILHNVSYGIGSCGKHVELVGRKYIE